MNTKRRNLVAAEGSLPKALLVWNEFAHMWTEIPDPENATVKGCTILDDNSKPHLSDYTLVILDYAAFSVKGRVNERQQDAFENEMFQAMRQGTHFCFVFEDEAVPGEDKLTGSGMNLDDITKYRNSQIGFRWLAKNSVRPERLTDTVVTGQHNRSEFKSFLDEWGGTNNAFSTFGLGRFEDAFYTLPGKSDFALGFSIDYNINNDNGLLIYIPFQRKNLGADLLGQATASLVEACIHYLTNKSIVVPEWGTASFFSEETEFRQLRDELEKQRDEVIARLHPYEDAKSLLFEGQRALERRIPEFITHEIGIPAVRSTEYIKEAWEDFWIGQGQIKKAILGAVRARWMSEGYPASAIVSVDDHRKALGLDETFPSLLILNPHLQPGSWAEMDQPIDKQDYEAAAQKGILILRIEDLLRLWVAKTRGAITPEAILTLWLTKKGWLRVSNDLEICEMR